MSKTEKAEEIAFLDGSVAEIATLKTQFDMIRFLKRVTQYYNCRTFMVLNIPSITSRELSENTVVTNWPAELMSQFDKSGMMQTSSGLAHMRKYTTPFVFDLAATASSEEVTQIFSGFGIQRGACFPVHDRLGNRGAVCFGGTGKAFDQQQMMELHYLSVHVYEQLAQIRSFDVKTTDVLTEREVDCLNWTAAGKTSAEIAEILGLSEHTVNHYLNRTARKLDTVNRTQAVAKALRSGIIK
jgi:DNA-binding CsgD family transcriptional regulator